MNKSRKQIAVTALGVATIIVITALVTYALTTKYGNKSDAIATNNTQQTTSGPDQVNPIPRETSIPDGTISPTTVVAELVKNPDTYKDKELKVRGIILRVTDDQYMITGQETDKPGSLIINKAASIALDEHVNDVRSSKEASTTTQKSAITATGKLSTVNRQPALTITSINE
jgi:hypothetical protein